MKTDIYGLLGMIKDNKAPKKIIFKEDIYEYRCSDCIDYYCDKDSGWLFDDYDITDILNDEVTILETTIKYNGVQKCTEVTNNIEKLKKRKYINGMLNGEFLYKEQYNIEDVGNKINEIIDKMENKL